MDKETETKRKRRADFSIKGTELIALIVSSLGNFATVYNRSIYFSSLSMIVIKNKIIKFKRIRNQFQFFLIDNH